MTKERKLPRKVYVVTEGEYSSYSILAVFSSRKLAHEYVEKVQKHRYDTVRIEEYELDKPPERWLGTVIEMDREGNVVWHTITVLDEDDQLGFLGYSRQGTLTWLVEGADLKRATKIVSEKLAAIVQAGVWGDNQKTIELSKGEVTNNE